MSSFPLPSQLQVFGFVEGRVIRAVADRPADPDRFPEAVGASGTVTFTPLTPLLAVHETGEGEYHALVERETVRCVLDDAGFLVSEDRQRGVWLTVGVWNVSIAAGGWNRSFPIEVTEAHTETTPYWITVAENAEIPPGPGVTVQQVTLPVGGPGVLVKDTSGVIGWEDVAAATGGVSLTQVRSEIDTRLAAVLSSGGSVHLGTGPPPDLIVGAKVGDVYIDTATGDLYELQAGA